MTARDFSGLSYEERRDIFFERAFTADEFNQICETFTKEELDLLIEQVAEKWKEMRQ